MAGDVWRWCDVHQKWLQDVNVKVTPRGLQNDRKSHSSLSTSSSSYSSDARPESLRRNAAAAFTRWQDDAHTRDPVPPSLPQRNKTGQAGKSPLLQSPQPRRSSKSTGKSPLLQQDQPCENPAAAAPDELPRVTLPSSSVKWLFQDDSLCRSADEVGVDENMIKGQNWVTVFRLNRREIDEVLREFAKCGTMTAIIKEPIGCNWVQIQYQTPREASLALMKSGSRLKNGLQVVVRNLDSNQRKQLLIDTNTKCPPPGSQLMPPCNMLEPADPNALPNEEEPPKSSISKFVDLVFDCGRDYQISPAGHVIPIRFEPGLFKEVFKWQKHSCNAFVTPLCDPGGPLPLYFEYPRKLVEPCEYAQHKLDELRTQVGGELASRCSPSFRPSPGAAGSSHRSCACPRSSK